MVRGEISDFVGIPLVCIIHSNSTEEMYKFGFPNLEKLLWNKDPFSESILAVFISDSSAAETIAKTDENQNNVIYYKGSYVKAR